MTDFIKVTDTNDKVFMLNKKHILKVESITNESNITLTRITLDLPDTQRDFALLFTKEPFESFINQL